MTQAAIDMYQFHVWANDTILKRLQEIPREDYVREIPSVFPSVSKVMPHIYITDYCWLEILKGSSMGEAMATANQLKADADSAAIEQLRGMFKQLSESYISLLNETSSLDNKIVLDNPYAGVRETSYSEIILQVVNHATYHRGNVTAMLRQMGHPSVMTEYALFWYANN